MPSASASSPIWCSPGMPEFFAKYAPAYLSRPRRDPGAGRHLDRLGAILSVPIAYARMSRNRLLSGARLRLCLLLPRHAAARADLPGLLRARARSAPQLEAVGLWGFFREAWYCAIFAFSLNTAAYQAEILRGAIESVPQGPVGRRRVARPAQAADAVEDHPAAGADRGAAALRQRDHPDDQGLGDRRHHHGLRPDGRNAARLFRAPSTSRPISGRR